MDEFNSDLFDEDPILDEDANTLADFEPDADEEPSEGGQNRTFMIAVGALVAVFLVGLITLVALVSLTQPGRRQAREEEVAQINAANTAAAATATAYEVEGNVQATLAAVIAEQASLTPAVALSTSTSAPALIDTEAPPGAASPTMVVVENTATTEPTATETLSPAEALSGDPAARTATVQYLLTLSAGGGGATAIVGDVAPGGATPVVQSEAMTATAYAYQATASGVTTTLPNTGFWDEVGIPVLLGAAGLLVLVIILVRRLRLSA